MTEPIIGYRHNPCRTCGRQVTTLGCTLCLDCICAAADAAKLRLPDIAKAIVERLGQITAEDIARDLAALSPEDCAARGILHSNRDDNSTAILDTDPDWMTRGMLGAAARKTLKQC